MKDRHVNNWFSDTCSEVYPLSVLALLGITVDFLATTDFIFYLIFLNDFLKNVNDILYYSPNGYQMDIFFIILGKS